MKFAKKLATGAMVVTVATTIGLNEIKQYRILGEIENDIVTNKKTIIKYEDESGQEKDKITKLENEIEDTKLKLELVEKNVSDELKYYEKQMEREVVFNSNDINILSDVPTIKLEKALEGTELEGLGYAYKQAEKEYEVNALFLVGLTAHESGWGQSRRARTQNNLSGYAVYNDLSEGTTFRTKFDCIMNTARLIRNDYLNTNGKCYRGSSVESISKMYVDGNNEVNTEWSNSIKSIANDLKDKIN